MMSSTFGAPFGGTTRGGHQGVDCAALRSILPPNAGGGGGSWLPSRLTVPAGEPTAVPAPYSDADAAGFSEVPGRVSTGLEQPTSARATVNATSTHRPIITVSSRSQPGGRAPP